LQQQQQTQTQPAPPAQQPTVGGDPDEMFIGMLVDMGFPREKAARAVKATGGSNIEAAMDWCLTHSDEGGQTLGGQKPVHQETKPQPEKAETTTETPTETPMETESTTTPDVPTEHNALCNNCSKRIVGIRWKCAACSDYDLCSGCYETRTHNPLHVFEAYEKDIENPEKKPLTAEELAERKLRLQQKIQQQKIQRAAEEKQAEIDREKNRVKQGKEAQEAKKLWEQKTREREEAIKRKEKEEDRRRKNR
jgi:hypothetical protein